MSAEDRLAWFRRIVRDTVQVHHAAPPLGAVQACASCTMVLQDNRPWYTGRVAVPAGTERHGPSWWPAGALVGKLGGMSYLVGEDDHGQPRRLDPQMERLCNGVN
jgi:hypothetical protein